MEPRHEVWIPPVHRDLSAGVERVLIEAATIGAIVAALDERFPGLAARLTYDGELRPGIAVAIDGVIGSRGLRQRLTAPSEIHFIPAMAGGCSLLAEDDRDVQVASTRIERQYQRLDREVNAVTGDDD